MMWGWYDGSSWWWMPAFMAIVTGAVLVIVVWVAMALSGGWRGHDRAMETLRRRLAAGEITQDEFEKIRRILDGD